MRVLLDTSVAASAATDLIAAGHDVEWVGDWPNDPGDESVLAHATHEGRVLITADKDFGELVVLRGAQHSGIVRLVGFRVKEHGRASAAVLALYEGELLMGALVTAQPGRVRVRHASSE